MFFIHWFANYQIYIPLHHYELLARPGTPTLILIGLGLRLMQ